ncbi:MAG TPA: hypothetical protein PLF23_17620 [Candidatus Obscuribacter sp.]|nr:hypothetical protein [Candidatus Obscuribacter sp.]
MQKLEQVLRSKHPNVPAAPYGFPLIRFDQDIGRTEDQKRYDGTTVESLSHCQSLTPTGPKEILLKEEIHSAFPPQQASTIPAHRPAMRLHINGKAAIMRADNNKIDVTRSFYKDISVNRPLRRHWLKQRGDLLFAPSALGSAKAGTFTFIKTPPINYRHHKQSQAGYKPQ